MRRTKQREQAFQLVFESLFSNENILESETLEIYQENVEELGDYAVSLFNGVNEKKEELDGVISEYSKRWKLNRIPKINIAILRLAIYEIKYVDETPDSVAINEAVELAKKYSGVEDSSFVNGILGAVVRDM